MAAEGSTLHGTASPSFTAADVAGVDHSWFGRLASAYLARGLARAHVTKTKDTASQPLMVKDFSDAGVLHGGRANHVPRRAMGEPDLARGDVMPGELAGPQEDDGQCGFRLLRWRPVDAPPAHDVGVGHALEYPSVTENAVKAEHPAERVVEGGAEIERVVEHVVGAHGCVLGAVQAERWIARLLACADPCPAAARLRDTAAKLQAKRSELQAKQAAQKERLHQRATKLQESWDAKIASIKQKAASAKAEAKTRHQQHVERLSHFAAEQKASFHDLFA